MDIIEKALPRPTDAELEILEVLWRQGPSTVRAVLEGMTRNPQPGYTTVLKMLQIMTEKGLVERDESSRAHIYRSAASQGATESHLVGDLVDRAFGGSAARLVLRALDSRPASPDELAEIRRLLETYEEGQR